MIKHRKIATTKVATFNLTDIHIDNGKIKMYTDGFSIYIENPKYSDCRIGEGIPGYKTLRCMSLEEWKTSGYGVIEW